MTITLGVNMNEYNFSHLIFELYPLIYFIFLLQELQNSIPWVPPSHYVLLCKIHTYMLKITLSSLIIENVLTFCSQFDTNLTLISWTNVISSCLQPALASHIVPFKLQLLIQYHLNLYINSC